MSKSVRVGDPGRSRVELQDEGQVEFWCREFGCTVEQLRRATAAAGNARTAVLAHLRLQGWANEHLTPAPGKTSREQMRRREILGGTAGPGSAGGKRRSSKQPLR
jgi:hypothetical protein